jgi:hypothetical protein
LWHRRHRGEAHPVAPVFSRVKSPLTGGKSKVLKVLKFLCDHFEHLHLAGGGGFGR